MNCRSYQSDPYSECSNVNKNDYTEQLEAGTAIEKIYTERTGMMGDLNRSTLLLQGTVELCYSCDIMIVTWNKDFNRLIEPLC